MKNCLKVTAPWGEKCHWSLNICNHLEFMQLNHSATPNDYGKQLMKNGYQGRWDEAMMGDWVRNLVRKDRTDYKTQWKSDVHFWGYLSSLMHCAHLVITVLRHYSLWLLYNISLYYHIKSCYIYCITIINIVFSSLYAYLCGVKSNVISILILLKLIGKHKNRNKREIS